MNKSQKKEKKKENRTKLPSRKLCIIIYINIFGGSGGQETENRFNS